MFCLTFNKNFLIFVERKAFGMNWRKSRCLMKPWRTWEAGQERHGYALGLSRSTVMPQPLSRILNVFSCCFLGIFCLFLQSTFYRIFLEFSREIFREVLLHQVCEYWRLFYFSAQFIQVCLLILSSLTFAFLGFAITMFVELGFVNVVAIWFHAKFLNLGWN